jgi:hypothetical protein
MVGQKVSYFRILPADELIAPDGVEKMVTIGEQHPEVDIIGCQERAGGAVLGTELPRDHLVFDGRCIVCGSLLNAIHGFPHSHCLFRFPEEGSARHRLNRHSAIMAIVERPMARAARTLKQIAVEFGMPAYRFQFA